ncbi:TIGR03503 family protein [Ferrimonas pelagia]
MPFGSVSRKLCCALAWGMALFSSVLVAEPQTLALLDNRFRIDHAVDEITILVRRDIGSAPVVVVQPDGSKWYAERHPESVRWSVTQSSDMIQIRQPTPGPWQLVGAVEPGSEVRLMTDINLAHDAFPETIYRGQRLKLTAEIQGDSDRIEMRDFYQQLEWNVIIHSANRPGDENFAAGPYRIGTYYDDGEGLDERPHDGIFTANLNFDYPVGLYELQMSVENPVFSRQTRQSVTIIPQPLRMRVEGEPNDGYQLVLDIEPEVIPRTLHLALSVQTPEHSAVELVITPSQFTQRIALPMLNQHGNYVISGQVVGTRNTGNEFYLELPSLSVYVSPPLPPPLQQQELATLAMERALVQEQRAREKVLWVVGIVNILLLVLGCLVLALWRKRQRSYQRLMSQPAPEADLTPEEVDMTELVSDLSPKKST